MTHPLDQVILVDEHDQQIGVMDKLEAHQGDGVRHRAISVFLFDTAGQLLLQQRSTQKIVGAGQWANTCCGNVRPTESYEQCAQRRLREELGIITAIIRPLCTFEYHVRCNAQFSEFEIDRVFVGEYAGNVEPNPAEVSAVRWSAPQQILNELGKDVANDATARTYAPWFHILCEQPPVGELMRV